MSHPHPSAAAKKIPFEAKVLCNTSAKIVYLFYSLVCASNYNFGTASVPFQQA